MDLRLRLYPDISNNEVSTLGVTKILEELTCQSLLVLIKFHPGYLNLLLQKYPIVSHYYSWLPYIKAAVA